jgi:hypothetical protein
MNKVELDNLLKEKGRDYVLMLYCNWFITLRGRQLDYVLRWNKNGKKKAKNSKTCNM